MVGVEDVGRRVVVRLPQLFEPGPLVVRGWLAGVSGSVAIVRVCEADREGLELPEFFEFGASWVRLEDWEEG